MSEVTITGVVATTALDRGATVTVERTPEVENLIAADYVRVVEDPETDQPVNEEGQPVSVAAAVADPANPPSRSATTAEWLEYVRGLGIEQEDDAQRAKLIADYDEFMAEL